MAGNGTAPKLTFDEILWKSNGSNPGKMTSWAVMGVAAAGLLTGKIYLDTGRYYEFFHHRDSKYIQTGVAIGTLAATTTFCLGLAQAWQLPRHAFTDFHNIRKFEATAGSFNDLIGAFLNLSASTFYCYRAYRMSGRKWWLGGGIMSLVITCFIMGLYVNIKGLLAPNVTIETVALSRQYSLNLSVIRKVWGGICVASDGIIMLTLMYFLISSRESIFHKEKRVYHKLVMLVLETMLPPVVCTISLVAITNQKGSPAGDFRRIFRILLPTLYWVSLLHTLVARADIRQMLGTSLASNGMLKPDLSTQAGESVFVATYGAGISDSELADTKERDLESGGGQRVVPIESYQRNGSPISDSSKKIKPAGI